MPQTSIEEEPYEAQPGEFAQINDRNIQALIAKRCEEEEQRTTQERMADSITRFTGSMTFVYLHLTIFGLWIIINLKWVPFIKPFDPSFVVLAMVASVEAIFLSTFVLISQNRMAALADKRADLDLHVSLLAEHEITRLVKLVTAIAERMEIDAARDPELSELAKDVLPEQVMEEMEEHERKAGKGDAVPAT
jgi:uncharacterized membrane protein